MKHEEEDLQIQCVKWFSLQFPKLAMLLHHSPNGGRRTTLEAARFKLMGTRKGFPDLVLFFPNARYHALFIEMKSKKGVQRPSQKAMQLALEQMGYRYEIVRDIGSFQDCIKRYFKSVDDM